MIERYGREVVWREVIERLFGLRQAAEACMEMGKRAAEYGPSRILGDDFADSRLNVFDASSELLEPVTL
jgi:hypothetical protein